MKSENINLILISLAYLAIGFMLAGNYTHDKTLKLTQDSIETLLKIEIITEKQFNNLQDRVRNLEKEGSRVTKIVGFVGK